MSMKKGFAAILAMLMLAACMLPAAAAAETEEKPLYEKEFEDFILRTEEPLSYYAGKADGMPVFMLYPTVIGNISMAAINAVWTERAEPYTAEEFTEMVRQSEAGISYQYGATGFSLHSFEAGKALEKELWGLPVLICDAEMTVARNDTEAQVYQRCIGVTGGDGTYLFSISAWSPELLEHATNLLAEALQWK